MASSSPSVWCATVGNCGAFVDDRDGNVYNWTRIGNQTWMAENLAWLPRINAKADTSTTIAKYYLYDFDDTSTSEAKATGNYTTYGVLYNFLAAQTACPQGWHLPDTTDWKKLTEYVNDHDGDLYVDPNLQATSGWKVHTGMVKDDQFGFSALPGGFHKDASFYGIPADGFWWSATPFGNLEAYYRWMDYVSATIKLNYHDLQQIGISVRCIKN